MDRITIYSFDRSASVTMPRTKAVTIGAREVSKSVTMASGKKVKDVIGHRVSVDAKWDWVPADTIASLVGLLRDGGFFYVEYPSPEGDASGHFEIEHPTVSVFRFKGGIAIWHDVTLSMSAQEVL